MKLSGMHPTNYFNTYIVVAADRPIDQGAVPPRKP